MLLLVISDTLPPPKYFLRLKSAIKSLHQCSNHPSMKVFCSQNLNKYFRVTILRFMPNYFPLLKILTILVSENEIFWNNFH